MITIYYIIEKLIIVNRKAHGNVPLGTMFSFHAVEFIVWQATKKSL
ncbi:MAG TPA: hypothetical protein PKN31_01120 [Candidatus Atribacteria bacterium]|nr:hypothetical protein [Candidatus Atribacteria bacterium]